MTCVLSCEEILNSLNVFKQHTDGFVLGHGIGKLFPQDILCPA